MPSVEESALGRRPLSATLVAGLETLDEQQVITFTKYLRVVLPYDGFVFWVKSTLLTQDALAPLRRRYASDIDGTADVMQVRGSLHIESRLQQDESELFAANRVVFTSESMVRDFELVGPEMIYIGDFEGNRFAFSQRGSFFRTADLHHYSGDTINPSMLSQVIDDLGWFNTEALVVSNSLPLWLSLALPHDLPGLSGVPFPLFPSFIVPQNQAPPYAAVHIAPESTVYLQPIPYQGPTSSHWQLARESVRIVLFGVRNAEALAFADYITSYCELTEDFGFASGITVRDEIRPQIELGARAQKKAILLEVNYYQQNMRNVARRFVERCVVDYIVPDLVT